MLLDEDTFFSWGPTSNEIYQAIIALHPQWQDFSQFLYSEQWDVGDVYQQAAFCGEGCGVNPAILGIALSMRLRWEIPHDGDLFLRATQAAEEFYHYYLLYYLEESVREDYPHIGNAATYSLYRFLGRDLAAVNEWCTTYQAMFGQQHPLTP